MAYRKALAGISLNVDAEMINSEFERKARIDFDMGDTTYRHDGFSIGKDYLRLEGRTVSRGELLPESLFKRNIVGKGAFSQVFKAAWRRKHDEKDTCVAVKEFSLLATSSVRRDMLIQELRALCRVNCECLVKLEGAFLSEDSVTMVLEFMDRGSLDNILKATKKSGERVQEAFSASVAFQMLTGISWLHREGMIHRDIKPGNVLVDTKGSVKLCDFGLASIIGDDSLRTTMVGTTVYMAPERLRARPYGRSSDLWSFGLVILECITREFPWKNQDIVSLLVSVEDAVIDNLLLNIHPHIQELIISCLQLRPEKRIPANLLLNSPWLLEDHCIKTISDARSLMMMHATT